jgi:hypothetical protein
MVGDELIMALTWEQGRGRESQVQPPLKIWHHYFRLDKNAALPVFSLINVRVPEEELEPLRPVVLHHHNYTMELRGARGDRPAIARFAELGRRRYEYAVYRPTDLEYAIYDQLLNETPNGLRGANERRWFIAPKRPRADQPWWPPAESVERTVRVARREAAEQNEVDAARETIAELAGAAAEGQAYESFTPRRRAIEERAMAEATKYFRARGWTVRDVSGSRSYDLECTRGRQMLHVEVKGTTSRGHSILLTANEVAHARDFPHTALFLLHSIRVSRGNPPRATGGQVRVIDPWRIVESRLKPLAYVYSLDAQ